MSILYLESDCGMLCAVIMAPHPIGLGDPMSLSIPEAVGTSSCGVCLCHSHETVLDGTLSVFTTDISSVAFMLFSVASEEAP